MAAHKPDSWEGGDEGHEGSGARVVVKVKAHLDLAPSYCFEGEATSYLWLLTLEFDHQTQRRAAFPNANAHAFDAGRPHACFTGGGGAWRTLARAWVSQCRGQTRKAGGFWIEGSVFRPGGTLRGFACAVSGLG